MAEFFKFGESIQERLNIDKLAWIGYDTIDSSSVLGMSGGEVSLGPIWWEGVLFSKGVDFGGSEPCKYELKLI